MKNKTAKEQADGSEEMDHVANVGKSGKNPGKNPGKKTDKNPDINARVRGRAKIKWLYMYTRTLRK